MTRRAPLLVVLVLALVGGLAVVSVASGDRLGDLHGKIRKTQGSLARKQGKARILTTQISGYSTRIRRLQGNITVLEGRQARIQSDLDVKRAKLLATQRDLRTARARLAKLRLKLARGRKVLAERLVELYQDDRPDIVTVVLSARGFSDLIESGDFIARVSAQDKKVITAVRAAKKETTTTVSHLGTLERRQRALTAAILERRNEVARVRLALVGRRNQFASVRSQRAATLATVRSQAATLHKHLDSLQSEARAVEAKIRAAQAGPRALAAGPIRGNGRFIWPVNGPITSPFCESRAWERCHPGIDIGVPAGTPIRAAGSGRVILMAPTSGYGNYTCIQHTAAISTCYAHQSRFGTHVGATVRQGQVIGYSGCTGLCFGDHLHFEVRVNGAVTNPLNYL
jgi:murein DD-endopeptidase MepM/ murein hydrolase activator NlpD